MPNGTQDARAYAEITQVTHLTIGAFTAALAAMPEDAWILYAATGLPPGNGLLQPHWCAPDAMCWGRLRAEDLPQRTVGSVLREALAAPGARFSLRLRGIYTPTPNSPLYADHHSEESRTPVTGVDLVGGLAVIS